MMYDMGNDAMTLRMTDVPWYIVFFCNVSWRQLLLSRLLLGGPSCTSFIIPTAKPFFFVLPPMRGGDGDAIRGYAMRSWMKNEKDDVADG
jgi:hypothetical protein